MSVRSDDPTSLSLYDRLGGQPGVVRLVDTFYDRVLADAELAPYFAEASLANLRAMQAEFFAAMLGGPIAYSGPDLSRVHEGRGITLAAYRRFTGHLVDILRDLEVPQADIDAVFDRLNLYADDIRGSIPPGS